MSEYNGRASKDSSDMKGLVSGEGNAYDGSAEWVYFPTSIMPEGRDRERARSLSDKASSDQVIGVKGIGGGATLRPSLPVALRLYCNDLDRSIL